MSEIVIISGKGGTGKTSLTAAFAHLGGKDILVADCDVDAADMHLLLKPDFGYEENFYSGQIPEINYLLCNECGKCQQVCRFNAIPYKYKKFIIDEINCEGCAYCSRICPEKAIAMKNNLTGKFFRSTTRFNGQLTHARLGIGVENSGKLVTKVRQETKKIATENKNEIILIDGPPGVGCPVIASLTGTDLAVMVTEPTVSGIHDFIRVYELTKKFNIPSACIINKAGLNDKISIEIKKFLSDNNISLLAEIPYHKIVVESLQKGLVITEYDKAEEIIKEIKQAWNKIKNLINNH